MYKIGVIGDRESMLMFKAVGFDVADVEEREEALQALEKFTSGEYAIIYITEQIAQLLEEEIEEYKDSSWLAIIVLPNNRGTNGMGMKAIKKSVERAVGADILFKDED